MSDKKNSWQSALAVAGMAAAGTLAAKLVQVGFDAVFANKGNVDMKRNAEWLNSARLMAVVTRIRVDSLQLAYTGNIEARDAISSAFDALRQKAVSLERSLDELQVMSEDEFISFKFQADSLRQDIADFEMALRDRGLVEPPVSDEKKIVEAIVVTEERKEETHDKAAKQSAPVSEPESSPEPIARTEEELA